MPQCPSNAEGIYESNYSVVIQTLRFSFLFWKIIPCRDLNTGPPGEKQMLMKDELYTTHINNECIQVRQIKSNLLFFLSSQGTF